MSLSVFHPTQCQLDVANIDSVYLAELCKEPKKMRIGLQIPNFTYQNKPPLPIILKDMVQTADEGGFYSLWVMDHFFQIENVGPAQNEMMESYTTLGYFAGLTKNVKL